MDNLLNLDIYESPIEEFIGIKEFNEFRSIMNMLDFYGTPHSVLYEAVMDPGNAVRQGARMTVRNTISTTGDVINAYDKTTTANANVIKATWDFIMKVVNLVIKGITNIMNGLANIPKMLSKTIDWVSGIPQKIRVKIRGDITLFITIEDINVIYNQSLLAYIVDIIGKINLVSQGDTWQKLLGKKKKMVDDKGNKVKINEHQLLRDINKLAVKIESIKFEPTVVKMNNEQVVNAYFSNSAKVVEFKDLDGTQHDDTYYDALITLVKDITSKKKELRDVQSVMGGKIRDSRENNNFAQLDAITRNLITGTFQTLSKVVSVVGNILRYVMTDVKTISKAAEKVRKKYNLSGMGESVYEEKFLGGIFSKEPLFDMSDYEAKAQKAIDEFLKKYSRPCIALSCKSSVKSDPPQKRTTTKIGGIPYWPKGQQYPVTSKGNPMMLIAQLNFSELPKLADYPTSGILQFFIDPDEPKGKYAKITARRSKVIYHTSIVSKDNWLEPESIHSKNKSKPDMLYFPLRGVCYPTTKMTSCIPSYRNGSDVAKTLWKALNDAFNTDVFGTKVTFISWGRNSMPRELRDYIGRNLKQANAECRVGGWSTINKNKPADEAILHLICDAERAYDDRVLVDYDGDDGYEVMDFVLTHQQIKGKKFSEAKCLYTSACAWDEPEYTDDGDIAEDDIW